MNSLHTLVLFAFFFCAVTPELAREESTPDLPGPIFYTILKNRLDGGQDNQFYITKTDELVVVDKYAFFGYEPIVTRSITVANFKGGVHSSAMLKFPKGRTYHDTDTRNWKVDKEAIVWGNFEYAYLDSIFSSGAVLRKRTEQATVLGIGLGGSSFNNYLNHVMPNFNITMVELEPVMEKISLDWFDLQLSDKNRVVIEDGVTFLAREAENNKHYDVLLLDATHAEDIYFTIAPVAVFYEEETLRNMAKVLGAKGVLIVNLFFGTQYDRVKGAEIIVNKFTKHFQHVEIRHVLRKRNFVLIARQVPIGEADSHKNALSES